MKKLESLNSKKFKSLNSTELNKLKGGSAAFLSSALGSSEFTVVWTKTKDAVDDSCDDDC